MGEMIKNFVQFLLSPNLVISYYIYQIRHLIIISALEIKQEEIDCVSSKKNTPIQTREMPDQSLSKNDRTSVTKRKKSIQEMVFSIKQKTNPFFPPLKTEISLKKSNEKLFALFCSCEFVLVINLSRQKKTKKHPKVT